MDAQQEFLSQLFSAPTSAGAGVSGVDAYGRNVAASSAQAGLAAGRNGINLANAYETEYRPYDQQFMRYVDNLGSPEYAASQRGRAMTDVQTQADMQRQQMERQGAAAGVNYGDPRFAFMRGQMAQQTALNKVMAAAGSDRSARDEWSKGLGAINAMGLNVGKLGLANTEAAVNLGKLGLAGMDLGGAARDRQTNAMASMTSAGSAGAGAAASMYNADKNYQLGLGRLALDRYGLETGNALKVRGLDDAADANSYGNQFLSSMGGAATNWLVNGGLKTLGNGVSSLFGGGNTNLFDGDNDFSGVTGSNSFDNWATFGSGGD